MSGIKKSGNKKASFDICCACNFLIYALFAFFNVFLLSLNATAQNRDDSAAIVAKLKRDISIFEEGRQARLNKKNLSDIIVPVLNDASESRLWLYDYYGNEPVYFSNRNLISQQTVSANRVKAGGDRGFRLNGAGITVGVWDEAVLTSHLEFAGRITSGDGAAYVEGRNHGTHVAGTVGAAGVNNNAQGFAHAATLRTYDSGNDLNEVTDAASTGTGPIFTSNHSYGPDHGWIFNGDRSLWQWNGGNATRDWKHGAYTEYTRIIDNICFNLPNYLMVRAVGNERGQGVASGTHAHGGSDDTFTDTHLIDGSNGYDCLPDDVVTKNTLIVGNVNDIPNGYSTASGVVLAGSSSTGPTDDGRIKPDLVANGMGLLSTVGPNNNSYGNSSGTSMAAPSVTGSIVLLHQQWFRYFTQPMRAHTMKALLVHTADEAGAAPGPDYQHGWGLLNVDKAARLIHQHGGGGCSMIIQNSLTGGSNFDFVITTNGSTPLKATLAWHEPAATNINTGTINPNVSYLINNLNLEIIGPGSTITYPWVLNPANPAAAATRGINNRDNVEQVLINSPAAGTYTIRVRAPATVQNGPQFFGLIVTGFAPNPNLTLNNASLNAVFAAQNSVTITGNSSNGLVNPARLESGNYVDLKPGFSALGSRNDFHAKAIVTNGCNVPN